MRSLILLLSIRVGSHRVLQKELSVVLRSDKLAELSALVGIGAENSPVSLRNTDFAERHLKFHFEQFQRHR